jgi:hypothetical protein
MLEEPVEQEYEWEGPADQLVIDDRHFRVVNASGKKSPPAGAGNVGEWLPTNEEVQNWKKF